MLLGDGLAQGVQKQRQRRIAIGGGPGSHIGAAGVHVVDGDHIHLVGKQQPGLPEAMRAASMQITPRGCLSREAAGIRGRTLILNLPGSEKAARENLLVEQLKTVCVTETELYD